jgi:alpha-beta hydrolase superfamily lysophospholipase
MMKIWPLLCIMMSVPTVGFATMQERYLYSHGLVADQAQAKAYAPLACSRITSFNYPDACTGPRNLDRSLVTLGQENDISALRDASSALMGDEPYVLIGMSRGASTALTMMALHNQPCVKAMILESPFDGAYSIVESLMKNRWYIGRVPYMMRVARRLLSVAFPNYDLEGIHPLDYVHRIRADLPMLIVCSLEDTTVSAASSMRLYLELRTTGHDHVYLLILESGQHSKLLQGNEGKRYKDTVHAFYQKYQCAYDPAAAQRGAEFLQQCQPTMKDLAPYVTI